MILIDHDLVVVTIGNVPSRQTYEPFCSKCPLASVPLVSVLSLASVPCSKRPFPCKCPLANVQGRKNTLI